MRDLKVGDVLIAKEELLITNDIVFNSHALIKGNEYPVIEVLEYGIVIESEIYKDHFFKKDSIDTFFTLKGEPRQHEPEPETLRDKIAIAAMNGLLSADWKDIDMVVSRAYLIADEMLKARNAAKD